MNIDEMTAGEEIDKLVAVRVMGDKLPQAWSDPSAGPSHGDPGGYRVGVKPYSTDIAAAWEVAEKMKLSVIHTGDGYFAGHFDVEREYLDDEIGIIDGHFSHLTYATAETAPLAICRAALKATGR